MAGLHVPGMLLFEVPGSVKVPPSQIAGTCVNVGVTFGFTVTVIVAVLAHSPFRSEERRVGKVVVLMAGLHVPGMLLFEVPGSVKVPPSQIAGTCVNVGVTFGFTVTVIVAVLAHSPFAGVKV